MSQAAAATVPSAHDASKSLGVTDGKLAMWIFLGSDGMSFMGLIAAYVALRLGQADIWPNPTQHLEIGLTTINTFILIISSYTMVQAYMGAVENNRKKLAWFLLGTIVGGATFLGIQVYEYTHQIHAGFTIAGLSDTYLVERANHLAPEAISGSAFGLFGATFYVLTCFHGFHVFSGVVYLTVVLIGVLRNRWNVNRIEILGLYWHFVDLVWIVIFTIVYLIE